MDIPRVYTSGWIPAGQNNRAPICVFGWAKRCAGLATALPSACDGAPGEEARDVLTTSSKIAFRDVRIAHHESSHLLWRQRYKVARRDRVPAETDGADWASPDPLAHHETICSLRAYRF